MATAAALLLSVLGLATTQQIRSEMKDQFRSEGLSNKLRQVRCMCVWRPIPSRNANEWASLRDEFNAAMREGTESFEDTLDEQFRRRFGESMYRTARARRRESLAA